MTSQLSPAHSSRVVPSFLFLLRGHLDEVVDPQDGNGGLRGKLEALDLAYGWLQHPCLYVIPHDPVLQVQSHPVVCVCVCVCVCVSLL